MSIVQSLRQWLFRFGRDEQSPIVLTQRRIFIVPSGAGLLFVVVLCVMLLGAINYDLSLGHALVFLLAGLGIVAMGAHVQEPGRVTSDARPCRAGLCRRSGPLPDQDREYAFVSEALVNIRLRQQTRHHD